MKYYIAKWSVDEYVFLIDRKKTKEDIWWTNNIELAQFFKRRSQAKKRMEGVVCKTLKIFSEKELKEYKKGVTNECIKFV
jgi:hypothetical protein